MDQNGQVLYIKSYNEKLKTVIFQFDDEYGTEKTIGSETIGYVDAFASNQNHGKISRYLLEYDEKGYVKTLRYAGFQNVPVGDANGIYGKQYMRDSKGRVIEETYLAYDGTPKATKWGMGKKVFTYDENDNWISSRYLTVDGEPALDAADGTSVCENVYDKYGNAVAQYFKTADGHFMLPGMKGVAGVKYEFDDAGFIKKQSFLGVDGNVEFASKQGYAISVMECNEYGFYKSIAFLDANNQPCVTTQGHASMRIVTDSKGNELERWNYNLNNEYVVTPEGYAGIKAEYDEFGHLVKMIFYGADGEPCELNTGIAGLTRAYNRMGDLMKESYFDTEGNPTADNTKVSTSIYERDIRGNITKVSFYDENDNPTLSSEGLAVVEYQYDDNGNETQRRFFDINGKPTKGYIGFALRKHTYDEQGHELSDRFYNTQGDLVLVNGIAGTDYKVDNHGNIIEEVPIGINQKLASGKLMSRYKYDDKDNLIEYALFDAERKPAVNYLNYHKYTQKFNERNQCVETCFYNTKGELTPFGTANYCIERDEYDERGLKTKVAYFDKDNKPAVYQGNYSSLTSEYDSFGRVVRQFFFDKNGNPTDPKVMAPEGAVEYDKWGNTVYLASLDGKGNLIKNPQTGWSIKRCEYDNHKNLLWVAFYNENDSPTKCKDGYHKQVNTYTTGNKVETSSYYDVDLKPALVNGFHQERYRYDDNNQCVEYGFYGKGGGLVNSSYGFARKTFTYNKDQSPKDRKYYNAAGTMLLQEQMVNGSWVAVKNWQKDVSDFDENLPFKLGEESGNITIQSAKVISPSRVELVIVTPKSKYDMSNKMIDTYKQRLEVLTTNFKQQLEIPKNVSIIGILKDSKGRELSRITK